MSLLEQNAPDGSPSAGIDPPDEPVPAGSPVPFRRRPRFGTLAIWAGALLAIVILFALFGLPSAGAAGGCGGG